MEFEQGQLSEPLLVSSKSSLMPQLRQQSQNLIRHQLIDIGFTESMIEGLFTYYEIEDLDSALYLLFKSSLGYNHLFIPCEGGTDSCMICTEPLAEHRNLDNPTYKSKVNIRSEQIKRSSMCNICYEDFTPDLLMKLPCGHFFCRNCIRAYLTAEITEGRVLKIKCCDSECSYEFDDMTIHEIIETDLFNKYKKFKRTKEIESDPTARWCPNSLCGSVVYSNNILGQYLKCNLCQTEICYLCNQEWHPKKTCEQASDVNYQFWARGKNIQQCPKCRRRIEKESGCNHMICISCSYEWCWLCRAQYSDMHFSPLNPLGCPGMQGEAHTKERWPLYKRWGLRALMILMIPLSNFHTVITFWFAVYIASKLLEIYRDGGVCQDLHWSIVYLCMVPLGFIVGLALTPIIVAFSILPMIFFFTLKLYNNIKNRLRRRSVVIEYRV